jgi:hypothetical protein
VFILVQQGLLGFCLGCSFAPNHKGMPILTTSDKTDFLRRQVLTPRNVRGGWLTDFALGGLCALGHLAAVGSELAGSGGSEQDRPGARTALTAQNSRLQPGSSPVPASPASWTPRRASRSPMARCLSAASGTGR